MEKEWITSQRACEILRRTRTGLRNLVSRGKLESRYITKGNRQIIEYEYHSVMLLQPLLGKEKRWRQQGPSDRTYLEKRTGYIKRYYPSHPRAMCDGYVYEHWLMAERKLKRPLKKGEQVHHINCIRDDNRIENLEVFSSRSDHMKAAHMHLAGKRWR